MRGGVEAAISRGNAALFFLLFLSLQPSLHLNSDLSLVLVEKLLHAHERLRPGPHRAGLGDGVHRFVAR